MDDKMREQLQCPICLELPDKKIIQCTNGHNVCETCSTSMQDCPQCRVSYGNGKVRNLAMEQLLEMYKVECPNKKDGCPERMHKLNLEEHIKGCKFSGKRINFCSQIGFKCDQFIYLRKVPQAIEHLQRTHHFIIAQNFKAVIQLEAFKTASRNKQRSMWTPIILDVDDSKFLLLTLFNGETQMISWLCVYIGEASEEARKFQVEFQIKGTSTEKQDLSWKVPPVGILNANQFLETAPFQLPSSLLIKRHLSDNENVLVFACITRVPAARSSWNSNLQPLLALNTPLKPENPLKAKQTQFEGHNPGPSARVSPSASLPLPRNRQTIASTVNDSERRNCCGCGVLLVGTRFFKCLDCNLFPYSLCPTCHNGRNNHQHHRFAHA